MTRGYTPPDTPPTGLKHGLAPCRMKLGNRNHCRLITFGRSAPDSDPRAGLYNFVGTIHSTNLSDHRPLPQPAGCSAAVAVRLGGMP